MTPLQTQAMQKISQCWQAWEMHNEFYLSASSAYSQFHHWWLNDDGINQRLEMVVNAINALNELFIKDEASNREEVANLLLRFIDIALCKLEFKQLNKLRKDQDFLREEAVLIGCSLTQDKLTRTPRFITPRRRLCAS